MRFLRGVYRINAGYFRDTFRGEGLVLPFREVEGEGGTPDGDIVLGGFTEVLQHPALEYWIQWDPWITVQWTCRVEHEDVRDLEGCVEFVA